MAVISVNYCEGNEKDLGYKSVDLYIGDKEEKFNTGDFPRDWYQACKYFLNHSDRELRLVCSSSVDHFFMDGAPYDKGWVIWKNNKAELVFEQPEGDGLSVYVEKGERLTFEQYRTKYSINNKKLES